jgi:hypothetical protein
VYCKLIMYLPVLLRRGSSADQFLSFCLATRHVPMCQCGIATQKAKSRSDQSLHLTSWPAIAESSRTYTFRTNPTGFPYAKYSKLHLLCSNTGSMSFMRLGRRRRCIISALSFFFTVILHAFLVLLISKFKRSCHVRPTYSPRLNSEK